MLCYHNQGTDIDMVKIQNSSIGASLWEPFLSFVDIWGQVVEIQMWMSSAILGKKLCISENNFSLLFWPESYLLIKECSGDSQMGST